jgi:hypothetical protein
MAVILYRINLTLATKTKRNNMSGLLFIRIGHQYSEKDSFGSINLCFRWDVYPDRVE